MAGLLKPWGKTRAGFKVLGSLNRFDYDLKWNALMEAGGVLLEKQLILFVMLKWLNNAGFILFLI